MRTIPFAHALFLAAALHAATEFPSLPEPEFADTETTTNCPFAFLREQGGRFAFTLDFVATASNNVEVAFGEDVDANGVLDAGEAEFVLAWDCGRWWLSGMPSLPVYAENAATDASAKSLSWCLCLSRGAEPRRLSVAENGRPLFAALSGEPPAWLYRREWNLVRVTARGVDRPAERLSVSVLPDSFILRLR